MNLGFIKTLVIWHAGTGERAINTVNDLPYLGNPPSHAKVNIIDGVSTKESRASINKMRGNEKSNENSIGYKLETVNDLLRGYNEDTHLHAIDETIKSINDNIVAPNEALAKQGKPIKKTNLIIGGYSRGSAVGMVGFLSSWKAALDMDKKNPNTKAIKNIFDKGYINKISLISVDPVAGIDLPQIPMTDFPKKQDYMGLKELKDNPLYKILDDISKSTKVPIEVTLMPTRVEPLKGLTADTKWQELVNTPPKGVKVDKVMTTGLNHLGMILSEKNNLYQTDSEKELTSPNKLLNTVIGKKLGMESQKKVDKMYEIVFNKESKILANLADGENVSPKLKKEVEVRNYIDLLGAGMLTKFLGQSSDVVEKIKNHKGNEPLLINGRNVGIEAINKKRKINTSKNTESKKSKQKPKI